MNKKTENKAVSPWQWVPSLYFAQGLPYVVVMSVAVILFKRMGMSNTDIALYTSGLNLPWVIKPLWSPLVDLLKTKRWWIVVMQILVGAGLAGIALTIQGPLAFRYCLAFMWLLAFSSATHDIAADGFYMLGLNEKKTSLFRRYPQYFLSFCGYFRPGYTGNVRRLARTTLRQGDAGNRSHPPSLVADFYLLTILFALLFVYHYLFLPHPRRDTCTLPPQQASAGRVFKEFLGTFTSFFQKKHIVSALIFILLYRFAEAQLVKITSPFLLDTPATGGLALSTAEVGFIYGTIGVIALTIGGIVGGIAMARRGLKSCLWTMTIAMNLPNIVYLYLSFARPESIGIISGCVAIEQFGYGFGFTSLTYFMMLFSNGKHQTAHYAICTGFMALGLMLPGMISGWIEESIGYRAFFVWIMLCTIPSFWATHLVRKNLTDNHSDNSSR